MAYTRKYVGRVENAAIMAAGYNALTEDLRFLTVLEFRESIISVLNNSLLKDGSAQFQDTGRGFRVLTKFLPDPPTYDFDFHYDSKPHTQDPWFMQAIAQFLVLTMNQLVVDLERAGMVKEVVTRILAECTGSIQIALNIIKVPLWPPRAPEASAGTESRGKLFTEINKILTGITDGAPVKATLSPDMMELTLQVGELISTIQLIQVVDVGDMLVFNANIAAALLAAKKLTPRGLTQLEVLPVVLAGYLAVRRSGGVPVVGLGGARPGYLRVGHNKKL